MVAILRPVTSGALPVFNGATWEDHVMAWRDEAQQIEGKQWRLGAIAASLQTKYGDKAMGKFATAVSAPVKTVWRYSQVFRQFEKSQRCDNLSWSHHLVALNAENPMEALSVAENEDLSVRELKQRILRQPKQLIESVPMPENCRVVSDLTELINDGEIYQTIYADPPWRYGNQGTRAATDNHYNTMTVDEICALPVRGLADTNAHLHLWTTNAFLEDAFKVIRAWGFEYKSCFVWCKPQMGIGNYWRVSHEFMLFGIKGSLPFRDRGQMSWDEIDRGEHSEKPEEVRRKIEKVSYAPFLELFGRITRPGWTIFGNQVWNPADPPKMAEIKGSLFGGL